MSKKIKLLEKHREEMRRRLWGAYYLIKDLCDMLIKTHNTCLFTHKLCGGRFEKCELWETIDMLEKALRLLRNVLSRT